jgi:hypothetical protein
VQNSFATCGAAFLRTPELIAQMNLCAMAVSSAQTGGQPPGSEAAFSVPGARNAIRSHGSALIRTGAIDSWLENFLQEIIERGSPDEHAMSSTEVQQLLTWAIQI